MAHYLLYFPDAEEPDERLFDRAGLSQLRNTGRPVYWHSILRGGPDEGHGMIATWLCGDAERDIDPNRHKDLGWRPATANMPAGLAEGWFWFGVDPSRPVQPADVQLPMRHLGHEVMCADGQLWHIPASAKLPHAHGINALGQWDRQVAPEYEKFAQRSMDYAVQIWRELDVVDAVKQMDPSVDTSQHRVSVQLHDADSHCCDALAMNYRVCPEIVDLLGLLDDATMIGIISATIDLPDIMAVLDQKKSYCPVGIPVG